MQFSLETLDPPSAAWQKWAMLLILFSLAAKVVIWQAAVREDESRLLWHDSVSYHQSAGALAELGRFSVAPESPDVPMTVRTPGYPAFLAAIYFQFGTRSSTAVLVQILMSAVSSWILFMIAARRFSGRPALLATLLLVLDLSTFNLSLALLSETLFAFLILLFLASLQRSLESRRWSPWAVAGLSLACAVLVRPIGLYLAPLVAMCLLLARRSNSQFVIRRRSVALLMAPVVLVVGGWMLRNSRVTGDSEFSSIQPVNLLYYRAAQAVAYENGWTLDQARSELGIDSFSDAIEFPGSAASILAAHPVGTIQMIGMGVLRLAISTPEHGFMRLRGQEVPATGPLGDLIQLSRKGWAKRWLNERPVQTLGLLLCLSHAAILYVGFACGWWRSFRSEPVAFDLVCIVVVAYFVAASAGPEAYHRFRVPFAPILALYAGRAVNDLMEWTRTASQSGWAQRSRGIVPEAVKKQPAGFP